MPFTFLAHQAPVLPLKLLRPGWFSGAGLVIGSMAPDFEKFVAGRGASRYAHSLVGQLTYCLPLSLAVYWLLTRVVAPPLARFLPDAGALRLRDYAAALAAPPRHRWAFVAASVLVGSISHVVLDGFTHGDRRVVALFPALGVRFVSIGGRLYWSQLLLQLGATVLGAAVTLALMLVVARRRRALAWAGLAPAAARERAEWSPAARLYWLTVAAVTLLLGGAVLVGELALADDLRRRALALAVVLRLPLTGFAALCAGAAVVRAYPPRATAGAPSAGRAPRGRSSRSLSR